MRFLLGEGFIPPDQTATSKVVAGQLLERIEPLMGGLRAVERTRGDYSVQGWHEAVTQRLWPS